MNQHIKLIFLLLGCLTLTIVVVYVLLKFWIVPKYVNPKDQSIVQTYIEYSLTISTTIIMLVSLVLEYFSIEIHKNFRVFEFIVVLFTLIAYVLVNFWVVPNYVIGNQQTIVKQYSEYTLTAVTVMFVALSFIVKYL